MSTALYFLIPIGLLAVAWSLCFVGCVLPTTGEQIPYSDYVLLDTTLAAYWPLNDLLTPLNIVGQTAVATDISGNNRNGTYEIPPDYPSGVQFSKPITGSSVARDTSIVPGDAGSKKNPFPASANFKGGFVSIPWNTPGTIPADLTSFTFEAWIKTNFSASDVTAGFRWVVFSALGPNFTGFVVFIDENNNWNVTLGNGSAFVPVNPSPPVPVNPNNPSDPNDGGGYLAVTFDNTSNTLNLYLNPDSDTSAPPPANFTTTAFTFAAVSQVQPVTFFIGAGDNNDAQSLRTMAGGPGAPLVPFQGQLQSVALYQSAISAEEAATHFNNGATTS
jgi:hypothetical protein